MIEIIELVSTFLYISIFLRVILTWFPQINPYNPLVQIIYRVTEPILGPIRKFIPRMGMLDISPMIALILIAFIKRMIVDTFS